MMLVRTGESDNASPMQRHPSEPFVPADSIAIRRWMPLLVLTACVGALFVAQPVAATELVRHATNSVAAGLTWWKAAILGVVEGVTEFLPISSTGHLLVTQGLLNLGTSKEAVDAADTYAIAIQFGAILAVAGLFWRRFVDMFNGLIGRSDAGRRLLINVVVAFLPAAVVGFVLDDTIKSALFGAWPVVVAWAIGGGLILLLGAKGLIPARAEKVEGHDPVLDITLRQALIIGCAQVLALWPGTSRSLVTILAAVLIGVGMTAAVEFSFLLGFVTLSAATAFSLLKDGGTLVDQFGVINPLIGAVFAFISAVIAIKWMLTYLERHSLNIFGWYRLGIATLTAGMILAGVI